ncbi:hypothetical protein [Bordetella ansorpii]|uniref:hypothetical protein n=1 Tax=Bordetella ansorpii TaxID=288768 RepID=UPI000833AE29|nr:hypothetical protein [Bordetella ansorpii]
MSLHQVLILAALVIGGLAVLAVCRRAWRVLGATDEGEARKPAGRWFYPVIAVCLAAWMATLYLRFG